LKKFGIFLIIFQSSGEDPCIVTAAWHYCLQFLELNKESVSNLISRTRLLSMNITVC